MEELVKNEDMSEVIIDLENGEFLMFNMDLPMQMLFDDAMTFVSKTDF